MNPAPIVALDKRTRDGRHLVVTLRPKVGTVWGYWMQACLEGEVIYERYQATVQRDACDLPGLPHLLSVGYKVAVALTEEEADGVEAAKREWTARVKRAALQAAPHAPTRVLFHYCTVPLQPGVVVDDGGTPAMSLGVDREHRIEEDGWSFGLNAEEGYLYDLRVRDLTTAERAEYEADQAHRARVLAAAERAEDLFGWTLRRARGLGFPDDARPVDHGVSREPRVTVDAGVITRADGGYYSWNHVVYQAESTCFQPATPECDEAFDLLYGASDRGDLRHLGIAVR